MADSVINEAGEMEMPLCPHCTPARKCNRCYLAMTTRFRSGVTSNRIPRIELIPISAVLALASRMEYGIERKGAGAWNALSAQEALSDREFLIDRLAHCAFHALQAIARILGNVPPLSDEEEQAGGDAGAIMFGGALLAAVKDRERQG